ncbi:MAG: tryptophan synthase subunit alpha [Phycisphaerae bacterium]
MTDRLTAAFSGPARNHRAILCPFVTAGYPSIELLEPVLESLQQAGAGCIELGIPFSDPIADGPTIQESYRLALRNGVTVQRILHAVEKIRGRGFSLPIMAMASFSIMFKHGSDAFAADCAAAGIDGLILPDVPLEEAPAVVAALQRHKLKSSLLIAPTTPPDRRVKIAALCTGFIYYLSVTGITGMRQALPADVPTNLQALRALTTQNICVGFGISRRDQVAELAGLADGIIVGSAIIKTITQEMTAAAPDVPTAVGKLAAELAAGLKE